jgi:hypothetical protein
MFQIAMDRKMAPRRHTMIVMFVLLCASCGGCNRGDRPPLGLVHGKVTLDGKPLPDALVRFFPGEGGRYSMGRTNAEGRYELVYIRKIMGAKVGPHKVMITTADETHPRELLPPRYHQETTLQAEVQSGENACDFSLTSQ